MYVKETVVQPRLQAVDTQCDVCGVLGGCVDPHGWHTFSSQHEAWGNDSVDFREVHNVCGVVCFVERLRSLIKDLDGKYEAEISDMNLVFAKELLTVLEDGLIIGQFRKGVVEAPLD